MQKLDSLGHAARREISFTEIADPHVPSKAILQGFGYRRLSKGPVEGQQKDCE
jgi:hypothetical protein